MSLASGATVLTLNHSGTATNVTGGQGSSSVFLETKDIAGDESIFKTVQAIIFEILDKGAASIGVTLKYREKISDSLTSLTEQTLGSSNVVKGYRANSIFFRLRIEDEAVVSLWRIAAIEFWGQVKKGRRIP